MSIRKPTPTGWSDSDWILHLEDEEDYNNDPMQCLHINRGSVDAKADSYHKEYNEESE